MIPDEMKRLRQWIMLPPGQKRPTGADWQKRPRPWDDIKEPNGRGFLLLGTPYLCIDGDHVLKGGAYVCQWAEDFFRAMLATGTYAERSLSKTGVHVFFKVDPGKTYEGHINELKGMGAKGGRYFDYAIPGFDHLPKNERPHVEIFYNAVQQICLTGDSIGGDTVEPAPAVLNRILEKMPAFSVPRAGDAVPPPAAPVERKTELPHDYDLQRAARMLDYIDPATLDYSDWIKVGAVLHDLGADFSLWDAWSQKDAARYKGERETAGKWRSFRRGSGATIAGLHALARDGGYSEKDFAREWHRTHPPDPKAEFEDLDAVPPPAAPVERKEPRPDNTSRYIDLFMRADIQRFKSMETGFKNLDEKSDGLYPGLYVVAAISSLGKTTFALQMAEQIATAGEDVVYFSLEQSSFEMVSKGIARRTALADMEKAVSSLSIRKGYLPGNVLEAAEQYKADVGERLNIVEGNFSCNIAYIANYIRGYAARNGKTPVVFVDYLQILQPTETRQGTKETVDLAVTELKRLSRAMSIPIVAISSINRANYLTPVDFESLKESGGIEYTADVILGLQLQILNDRIFQQLKSSDTIKKRELVKDAKAQSPRKIELVCLKNRFGVSSYSCFYDYYPAYDLFKERETFDFEELLC